MRGIYGRFDSKIRFEIESDSRFDSKFDSNAKKRFAGPYYKPPIAINILIDKCSNLMCVRSGQSYTLIEEHISKTHSVPKSGLSEFWKCALQ